MEDVLNDGTDTFDWHQSSIWQVWTRFQGIGDCGWWRGYIYGPNMQASNAEPIFFDLFGKACNEVKDNDIQKVFVIGFSRGAMNAIRFANDFSGCANGKKVHFIGISDPVDTLMGGAYDYHKSLLQGRSPNSYKVYKINNSWSWNPVDNAFITHRTPGFNSEHALSNHEQNSNKSTPDRHWMMNASTCVSGRDVEERLITEMKKLNVTFSGPRQARGPEPCKM